MKSRGFVALTKAPTAARPHRYLQASGESEADALVNLASKIVEVGANPEGVIQVASLEEEGDT